MASVRCLQHCRRHVNILCFIVPRHCPLCGADMEMTESRIPPYPLPSPFIASDNVKTGIVIRPTQGDFISNYTSQADLHIGVTDSAGCLYDYDEDGLHIGGVWSQCVHVQLPPDVQLDTGQWDRHLSRFADQHIWCRESYHENVNNCFNFVLRFLQSMDLHHFIAALCNKTDFAAVLVAPGTTKAAQYVALCRRIQNEGFVCQTISVD